MTPLSKTMRCATFEEIENDTVPAEILERLLFEDSPTLYCGLPKRGKSYSAAQAAVCLASGSPFLGLSVRKSRVLYLSWELAVAPLRDRMVAIARDVGLPDPMDMMRHGLIQFYAHRRQSSAKPIDLTVDSGWVLLRELIEDANAEVAIIDTLSKVAGLEMKDTLGWAELLTRLNRFCRDESVAVLAIDHASRMRMEENASVVAMGSQVKGAVLPTIVKLTESKDEDPADRRWRLDVDGWFGDGGPPIWFRRPGTAGLDGERYLGVGCVLADPPTTLSTETESARCLHWLRSQLAAGRVPKARIIARGEDEGFSKRTLERAFSGIGGRSFRGFQGSAQWELPADA